MESGYRFLYPFSILGTVGMRSFPGLHIWAHTCMRKHSTHACTHVYMLMPVALSGPLPPSRTHCVCSHCQIGTTTTVPGSGRAEEAGKAVLTQKEIAEMMIRSLCFSWWGKCHLFLQVIVKGEFYTAVTNSWLLIHQIFTLGWGQGVRMVLGGSWRTCNGGGALLSWGSSDSLFKNPFCRKCHPSTLWSILFPRFHL